MIEITYKYNSSPTDIILKFETSRTRLLRKYSI